MIMMENEEKDSLFDFITMYDEDLDSLKAAISDSSNSETFEFAKQQLYKDITAKYNAYIPQFSDGLYGYDESCKFYIELSGTELFHDLRQIYQKMLTVQKMNYAPLRQNINQNIPIVQISNTNKNQIEINVSVIAAKEKIQRISELSNNEKNEILNRIDQLEKIIKLSESKSKKWEYARDIIKWIADKGGDVFIALVPLLLQIA